MSRFNPSFLMKSKKRFKLNDIGIPGGIGFGVGIHPRVSVEGFTNYSGTTVIGDDNYGNYLYSDGSVMVWNPFGWYRIGHPDNPTYGAYGVNSIHIVPESTFSSVEEANSAGYAAHRAFYDGGSLKRGFFYDKYECSNNGGIPSSLKNGNPISTAADHNPISGLTGSPANAYYSVIAAAKLRGSNFHDTSAFQRGWLKLVQIAHAQAATSATYCAWYDETGVKNYPKGNNNNALGDTDDSTVHWESDGYSNCGKTGSCGYGGGAGNVFAKSTHNGQNCGIADLNGNMWKLDLGISNIATTVNISGVTRANPCVITTTAHGKAVGSTLYAQIESITGTTQLNNKIFTATVVDATHISLNVDSSAFTAYSSGGTVTFGDFYVAKTSVAMKDFTGGVSLATDHWGTTGVAAMMDSFVPIFRTDYPNNGFAQRFGRGSNQVFSGDLSGANWVKTGLGLPFQSVAIDPAGTNLFGKDYYYQYIVNQLFMQSGGYWNNSSRAGCSAVAWFSARTASSDNVSFRLGLYAD